MDYHGIVTHTGKLTADHYLKCLENGEPRQNHMSVTILLDQPPNHQQPQPLDHQVAGNFNPISTMSIMDHQLLPQKFVK